MSERRDPACESLRPALIQRAEVGAPDPAVDAHAAGCGTCRRELERAVRRVGLARSLARVVAPRQLDGLVVAALQAGARQERAVRAVLDLPDVAAPRELAERVEGPRAPRVLERLVSEDLADPSKAVVRRYASRLERLRAPADLADRLRTPRQHRRVVPALLASLLVGAGVLLLVGVLVLTAERDRAPTAAPGPVLVVERAASIHDLDPAASLLASGLTGGLVDADRLSREGS
ncbi:MAG: hypothetical protein JNK02_13855 [Planctomycetes bacterium]|nr:hypothetical protein [Planctomycetota bacterium]